MTLPTTPRVRSFHRRNDEPIFLTGADPMTNLYLWQVEYVDLIFHNEETVKKHGPAAVSLVDQLVGAQRERQRLRALVNRVRPHQLGRSQRNGDGL